MFLPNDLFAQDLMGSKAFGGLANWGANKYIRLRLFSSQLFTFLINGFVFS
jgi:hypothetical protein